MRSGPVNERLDYRPCDCWHGWCWHVPGVRVRSGVLKSADLIKCIDVHFRLHNQQRSLHLQRPYRIGLGRRSDPGSGHRWSILRRERDLAMGEQLSSAHLLVILTQSSRLSTSISHLRRSLRRSTYSPRRRGTQDQILPSPRSWLRSTGSGRRSTAPCSFCS